MIPAAPSRNEYRLVANAITRRLRTAFVVTGLLLLRLIFRSPTQVAAENWLLWKQLAYVDAKFGLTDLAYPLVVVSR